MLTCSALMGRQKILHIKNILKLAFQLYEGFRTCIAVISFHHSGHLLITHSINTAVGQHIKVHITIFKQKSVVSCFADCCMSAFNRNQIEFLHNAYLVHFKGYVFSRVKLYLRQAISLLNKI